jgi:hypothetical protein
MNPCVIILNGYPGVGKLTIARCISAILAERDRPCTLVHNHELIDPVAATHPERNEQHYALRKQYRKERFDELASEFQASTILLTVCLGRSNADINVGLEHLNIALLRRVRVHWINLICTDLDEHKKRVTSHERIYGETTKCTNFIEVETMMNKPENQLAR